MTTNTRMSPITALFLGIFGVGGVGIAAGTCVILYSLRIIDRKAETVLDFAEKTVDSLPELVSALPPALDVLSGRRAPDYADKLDVAVRFTANDKADGIRPVLTILNKGSEVVSMLAVRVVALDARSVPVREWTEVVATPIAIDDEWRGILMPGAPRYVVLPSSRAFSPDQAAALTGVVEISELRIWQPADALPKPGDGV
jgi:hypothetical protein